jgi:type IV pilus assembly PilN-like protein
LDQISQQEQELASREKDLQKELDQPGERVVFQKAHFVNNLIQERQLTLTGLTQRASRLLPPTVRLSSLAVSRPREGVVVRFTVVGNDERGLEAFMGNLEDSPDFEDMTVTNQKLQQTSSATGQLGVTCTVRYVGAGAR